MLGQPAVMGRIDGLDARLNVLRARAPPSCLRVPRFRSRPAAVSYKDIRY